MRLHASRAASASIRMKRVSPAWPSAEYLAQCMHARPCRVSAAPFVSALIGQSIAGTSFMRIKASIEM